MFALSNAYLGLRGTWNEGASALEPGVSLNGFYEYRPISYGEHAYGFPRRGQSILNRPDGTIIKLFIDDEPFIATKTEVVLFHRTLDLKGMRAVLSYATEGSRLDLGCDMDHAIEPVGCGWHCEARRPYRVHRRDLAGACSWVCRDARRWRPDLVPALPAAWAGSTALLPEGPRSPSAC